MASYNRVIIMGNLGRDPELKYTQNGTAVTEVSLAVNSRRKKGEEWVEETTWVGVVFWGRTAEVLAEYAKKGSNIHVEGRLAQESWTTPTGEKRSKTKVVCESLQLLGSRNGQGGGGNRTPTAGCPDDDGAPGYAGSAEKSPVPAPQAVGDDEIPF